ncbi:ABC transporter ATP-binding protein [Solibacillus sp. R5-41]|uniref:response regulator transcription factor n=1 Tax=Solibacillus sp. R5-41 TaxID=2048654 RepID=UPI000C126648|nr:response regulator transcription factor [Solibacillus sp. R5-41]ATP38881.1 ABC transporter ATP-binding protein [Solibacillus sp. R5-41]
MIDISLKPCIEAGELLIPAINLKIENKITAINTDVTKINYLKQQLLKEQNIYVHMHEDGQYDRLTVEETFRYYTMLYETKIPAEQLWKEFGLQQQLKNKVGELTSSEKRLLSFIQPLLQQKQCIAFIEPFQNLQQVERKIIMHLLSLLQNDEKQIILLSNNLEDLIISSGEIFRLNEQGLHPIQMEEELNEPSKIDTVQLKIEKIPIKKDEKIILFNPPEIDYIESIEGDVFVYVGGESFPCTLTLNDLENRLKPFGFFRCHRSYIVNLQKVREIISWTRNSYSLSLQGFAKAEVPISRNKLTELKDIVGI